MSEHSEHHRGKHDGERSGSRVGTRAPGEGAGPHGDRMGPLRDALVQLNAATKQVAHAGTPDQAAAALEILVDARKRLYGMLAE